MTETNDRFSFLETESKLILDQIKATKSKDYDIVNFLESEKKKYKKTDEIEDLLNKFDKRSWFFKNFL